jgi:hypothetical protein
MIEHWMERYHQSGYRYDDKWRMLKGEVFRSNLRVHREHIAGDMKVKQQHSDLIRHVTTDKRLAALEREENTRKAKATRQAAASSSLGSDTAEEDVSLVRGLAAGEGTATASLLLEMKQGGFLM